MIYVAWKRTRATDGSSYAFTAADDVLVASCRLMGEGDWTVRLYSGPHEFTSSSGHTRAGALALCEQHADRMSGETS